MRPSLLMATMLFSWAIDCAPDRFDAPCFVRPVRTLMSGNVRPCFLLKTSREKAGLRKCDAKGHPHLITR